MASKSHLWDHIKYARSFSLLFPWIVARYFNAILGLEEKRGGMARLEPSSLVFIDNIVLLNLTDIKPINGLFTWSNRRCGEDSMFKRLDRFLVSKFWIGNN